MANENILVLGIGNMLMRDDGIGVHVVNALRPHEPLPGADLMDGGTSGVDLVDEIADRPKVIVIDAMDGGGAPGTVYRITPADLMIGREQLLSLHEYGFLSTMETARQLGCPPRDVVIFGVQPESIELDLEMSPAVAAAVPKVVALVLKELGGQA